MAKLLYNIAIIMYFQIELISNITKKIYIIKILASNNLLNL